MQTYSREEVALHSHDGDNWIIIDGNIYDMSKFCMVHPGGKCNLKI